jgi:HD-GYP domain-containing protein (c-di-GMP phosphodiesterase class II)
MRVMLIEKVTPGMIIERAVMGRAGEVLLSRGMPLDQKYIDRIKDMGIPAIYIRDENIGHIEYDEVVSDQTKTEVLRITNSVVNNIKLNTGNNIIQINKAVNDLITEITSSKNLLVALVDMRSVNDESFNHGINTAVLSVITGIAMGYSREKLRDLATGALFHDIGILMLPAEIVNKKTPLTPENDNLIKSHPQIGFDLLRKKHLASSIAAHIALQHHEKFDGTGYPQGLAGEEINEMARIVTIVTMYDNVVGIQTNGDTLLPHQAIEFLSVNAGKWFDPKIFKLFCSCIAIYPIGMTVYLNTGETAVVVKANKDFSSRPKVRVYKDRKGELVSPPFEIDLVQNTEYFITRVQLDE